MISILSVQMGINWYAAQRFVREVAVDAIHQHNVDTEAHAKALMVAQQERHEMIKAIVVLQAKIDGIDRMLQAIAANGGFNMNGRK